MAEDEVSNPPPNKVVLIGDHGVGKTSLFTRFKSGTFETMPSQKRREAEHFKLWIHNGKALSITLFDTAGMERFDSTVPPTYFRNAKAVIFVYAIDNQESIDNITHWNESVSYQRLGVHSQKLVKALVANKVDLDGEREVTTRRGQDTADTCEISRELFFELSALTGDGVDEMFTKIAEDIRGTGEKEPNTLGKPGGGCCSRN